MPQTFEQWVWFAFFAGGSLGGWLSLLLVYVGARQYFNAEKVRK